ncbi:MAG: glycosyltransferase family 2 protein [Calditrichaeota bacterium]|nr:MAG: glycosyltransferase family 2 protein [Calditrichota bacterium]
MNTNRYEFSVIIPNRNCKQTLIQVLHALETQSFARDQYEVIVIDDGSTDGSFEFLQAYRRQTSMNLIPLHGKMQGAGSARNIGLNAANGRLILFLDADTIPRPDVLRLHALWQGHYGPNACILGRVLMSEKLSKRRQGRQNDTVTRYDDHAAAELEWQDYRTANTSLSRELCLRIGGFDENLPAAEDTEFASRLRPVISRFIFISDIQVTHHHPMTPAGYFGKGALYGRAVALWYQKAPELRYLLIKRYGVFAPEMARGKKIKYFVRALAINRLTIPFISFFGRTARWIWFEMSEGLYRVIYRYQVRRAFRASLRNI